MSNEGEILQSEMFDSDYALRVGRFYITGECGGNVKLNCDNGTLKVFEVTPDIALKIADSIKAIATCAKYEKAKRK